MKTTGDENKENVGDEQPSLGSKERKRVIESPQAKVPPNKKPVRDLFCEFQGQKLLETKTIMEIC